MKLKHLIIMILLSSILFSILFFIFSILSRPNTEDVNNEIPPPMEALIVIDGTEYPLTRGGYKWKIRRGLSPGIVQTDHASPDQMADHIESIHTNPNQTVDLQIEGNPKIKVYLWDEKGRGMEIEEHANQITLPSSKGKYIYETLAKWSKGTISYTFVVEISR